MNIKQRNIVTSLILSFITFGIYAIYWTFCLGREAVSVKESGDDGMVEGLLCAIIPIIGFYLAEKKLAEACAAKGIAHEDRSIIYIILGVVLPIASPCLMQSDLNKLA